MTNEKIFLEKIFINNYLSLHKVTLPLKPLTVLVGPNASGKTNVLHALNLLSAMMSKENLPEVDYVKGIVWAGVPNPIRFELHVKIEDVSSVYTLELEAKTENPISLEKLLVNEVEVIKVKNGIGKVRDEDGDNSTPYNDSNQLVLKSAGSYGHKPVTKALLKFIRDWQIYDFEPDAMRSEKRFLIGSKILSIKSFPKLDSDGSTLQFILSDWYKNDESRFQAVNEGLNHCTRLGIEQRGSNGDTQLFLQEGYKNPIPLKRASDGTLRLIAYHVLLNQPQLPPLIAIEEPERNLHPAALMAIADILERLSDRTQVIITTHSSQLLDSFNAERLADKMEVLLLRNNAGAGTVIKELREIQRDRQALSGWITDFGIGSAVFESELLQDVLGG